MQNYTSSLAARDEVATAGEKLEDQTEDTAVIVLQEDAGSNLVVLAVSWVRIGVHVEETLHCLALDSEKI